MNIGGGLLNKVADKALGMGVSMLGDLANMAQTYLADKQDLAFSFTAATGTFEVVQFSGVEAVNAPFEITVSLVSEDPNIDLHALMDTEACLGIFQSKEHDKPRFLSGIVTEAERGDSGSRRTFYSVTLRPTLYRLAHTSDSRIWQKKSIPTIVAEVLADNKIVNVEWQLSQDHHTREYATQYRETGLDFIERVLAEEGIFYYFEHTDFGHKIIFTDSSQTTPVLALAESITYNPYHGPNGSTGLSALMAGPVGGAVMGSGLLSGVSASLGRGMQMASTAMSMVNTVSSLVGFDASVGTIGAFSQREKLRANGYELNDYSFKNPSANYKQYGGAGENNGLVGEYTHYDHPGRYKNPGGVGSKFARTKIESVRVDATTGTGVGNNIHLCPGFHFSIEDHDDDKANIQHFVLRVSHAGQQSAALEEDAGGEPTRYFANFETMPGRIVYQPPQRHKPLVDGPQIAIVTGPPNEEIHCDEFGRVTVWFPWDKRGDRTHESSCWIRVSQNWAGGSYGQMAVPRIGHEVIVDFLEGDPDQPIITGRTYHANNKPPYDLPSHKTRMTIKSKTHKGDGFNELRFEDEADKEEVFLHAQKDHNVVVRNDEAHNVGHDRNTAVANDDSEYVGQDKKSQIVRDQESEVGNDLRQTIKNDVTYQVVQNQQESYGKDHIHTVGNIHKQTVMVDHLYELGRDYAGLIKGNYELEVYENLTTTVRNHTLIGVDNFEIKGPGGSIKITSSGITIEAANITLKGSVSMGGSGSAQVPTLQTAAVEELPICEECEAKGEEA